MASNLDYLSRNLHSHPPSIFGEISRSAWPGLYPPEWWTGAPPAAVSAALVNQPNTPITLNSILEARRQLERGPQTTPVEPIVSSGVAGNTTIYPSENLTVNTSVMTGAAAAPQFVMDPHFHGEVIGSSYSPSTGRYAVLTENSEVPSESKLADSILKSLVNSLSIENKVEVFNGQLSVTTELSVSLSNGEILKVESLCDTIDLEDLND